MKHEKAEKLFHLLGDIDDDIIVEVEAATTKNMSSKVVWFKRKKEITRLVTASASVAFVVFSIWGFHQFGMQSEGTAENEMTLEAPELNLEEDTSVEAADDPEYDLYRVVPGSVVDDLKVNPDFRDVVLTVDISDDGTQLFGTIINHSETVISPSHLSLEYFDGLEWRHVQMVDDFAFVDIGWIIFPEDEHEFSLDLTWYAILEGYPIRLRKTVWPDGEWPYGWNQTHLHHDLVYEFELVKE